GNEDIGRFWRHRFHDLLNLVRLPNAGSIETIGPSLSVRGKPLEDDPKWISTPDQPRFTSPGQHHWNSGPLNGATCGTDALDSQFFFVERRAAVPGVVVAREASHTLGDAEICICGHRFRLIGESVQEIGIDRQGCGGSNFTDMSEHFVEGYAAVGFAAGKGETRGGSGEGVEAEML